MPYLIFLVTNCTVLDGINAMICMLQGFSNSIMLCLCGVCERDNKTFPKGQIKTLGQVQSPSFANT